MNPIFRLLQICLGGCRHSHTIRERRTLHGVDVLHFVCEDCGYAAPAVERTALEHQRVVEAGAIKLPRSQQASTNVVQLRRPRARRRAAAM
jgi:hypothetical protein